MTMVLRPIKEQVRGKQKQQQQQQEDAVVRVISTGIRDGETADLKQKYTVHTYSTVNEGLSWLYQPPGRFCHLLPIR